MKLIPNYFILFDAIVNKIVFFFFFFYIVFLISLSDRWLFLV